MKLLFVCDIIIYPKILTKITRGILYFKYIKYFRPKGGIGPLRGGRKKYLQVRKNAATEKP